MSRVITRSTAKRRRLADEAAASRLRREDRLSLLPDEILLRSFTYTECCDVASICRVSSRLCSIVLGDQDGGWADLWRQLAIQSCGSVLEQVWESLHSVVCDKTNQSKPLTDLALWRRVFSSHVCARLGTDLEDCIDCNKMWIQRFRLQFPVSSARDYYSPWIFSPASYSFALHV